MLSRRAAFCLSPLLAVLSGGGCVKEEFSPAVQLEKCHQEVTANKVDRMMFSIEVARCMEQHGLKTVDPAGGLLNAANWRR